MTTNELRLRLCPTKAILERDLAPLVTCELAGDLLGWFWREVSVDDQILSTPLTPDDAKTLGLSLAELRSAALANVADRGVRGIDIMRVTDACRLFIFQDEDPGHTARMLDVESLFRTHEKKLPAAAKASARMDERGALVAAPFEGLLMVFCIAGGDFLAGIANLAENAHANHDPAQDGALSPWIYWVRGAQVEEVRYELEDGEVASVDIPEALHASL